MTALLLALSAPLALLLATELAARSARRRQERS
jgi:hypothetical protein